MAKRTLIILGHPSADSLCGALAERYRAGAEAAGVEIRTLRLGELRFDPILHDGYRRIQPLEPDLEAAQRAILWAEHLVFVYPIWWGALPALLKGFIDRIFLPGFAFKYRPDSPWWDKLLKGRSAHLLVTLDTPAWYYRLIYRAPGHHQMKKTILQFSGVDPVRITSFSPTRYADERKKEKWLAMAEQAGRKNL